MLVAAGCVLVFPGLVAAQSVPEGSKVLADFDARVGKPLPVSIEAEWLARASWVERTAGVRFGPDTAITMTPFGSAVHHLYRRNGWLTPPADGEPLEITRGFLLRHRELFELSPESIDALVVVKDYRTAHNGVRHLMWDAGYGLDIENVYRSGWIMLGAAAALTVGAWTIGLAVGG